MSRFAVVLFLFALIFTVLAAPASNETVAEGALEKRARTGRVRRIVSISPCLTDGDIAGHMVLRWPRSLRKDQQGQRQDHRDLLQDLRQGQVLR